MPAATTTNDLGLASSTCTGAATFAAPKLATLTQTAQAWPLPCVAESYWCTTANASAVSSQTASAAPSHVFHVTLRHRRIQGWRCIGRL